MANTPGLRVAFRFRQFDRRWWEVFSYANQNIQQAIDAATSVRTDALTFRAPSVYISHARVSNPLAPRQAQIVHFPSPDLPAGNILPAITSTAAIYEFACTDVGVKRHIWLRGLRETDVRRRPASGADNPAGDLDAQVKSYYAALKNQSFGVANLQPVDNGNNKRHPITSITVLATGQVRCNIPEAFVLGDNQRVVLYKVDQKKFPGLRGRFTVIATGNTFVPQGYLTPLAAGDYTLTAAAFRKEEYRFSPFQTNGCTFLAFDRRDTQGGPLDTRGRSRPVVRRSP